MMSMVQDGIDKNSKTWDAALDQVRTKSKRFLEEKQDLQKELESMDMKIKELLDQ